MHLTFEREQRLQATLDWIIQAEGPSPYYSWLPRVALVHDTRDNHYGWLCVKKRALVVNMAMCTNMRVAVATLLHEYKHYLQAPWWYTRYDRMYGYWKNPYEIQANEYARERVQEALVAAA